MPAKIVGMAHSYNDKGFEKIIEIEQNHRAEFTGTSTRWRRPLH